MADTYYTMNKDFGTINISEEVISSLIKGIVEDCDTAELASTAGGELSELLGKRGSGKGIKIQFVENEIEADIIVSVKYGGSIVDTAKNLQESIASAVCTATGAEKVVVNIHVSGIIF